jgi:hypothetical protein
MSTLLYDLRYGFRMLMKNPDLPAPFDGAGVRRVHCLLVAHAPRQRRRSHRRAPRRMKTEDATRNFWGAQAASLQFAAACREHPIDYFSNPSTMSARQAAGRCKLAACAPQTGINPHSP